MTLEEGQIKQMKTEKGVITLVTAYCSSCGIVRWKERLVTTDGVVYKCMTCGNRAG